MTTRVHLLTAGYAGDRVAGRRAPRRPNVPVRAGRSALPPGSTTP